LLWAIAGIGTIKRAKLTPAVHAMTQVRSSRCLDIDSSRLSRNALRGFPPLGFSPGTREASRGVSASNTSRCVLYQGKNHLRTSGVHRNPWKAPFASMQYPVIAPAGLLFMGTVP